tara:strand:- start:693 stop:1052 length:360 start_codon:yes stop_codon:yes gene_type:complete
MPRELIAKYQLSGVDERDRGFSRQVRLDYDDGKYIASLKYEKIFVETDGSMDEGSAVEELVRTLHQLGYVQLQTQRSFSGMTYLGTHGPCVEYPDSERLKQINVGSGIFGWIRHILTHS